MKKSFLFLLFLISLFTIANTNLFAIDEINEFAGARYQQTSVVETNELPYGIYHEKVLGQTSTSMWNYDVDGLGGISGVNVVPGKFYPQQVNVLQVPTSTSVKVTSWANLNNHRWTLTTVKGLINDYENKNPGWKVVAAINGDFFDIGADGNLPYQTSGPLASDGNYYRTSGSKLVGFANDGSSDPLIGNEVITKTTFMKLAVYNSSNEIVQTFDVQKINTVPGTNETAVYYATYNTTKQIVPVTVNVGTNHGYFVDSAELALPNQLKDFYGLGTITSTVSKTISTGQFAIVTSNPDVVASLAEGVRIRVQYEYTGAYANVKDISGAGTTIVKDGRDNSDGGLADRAPRTVIGRKPDGTIVMMVIDGRQSSDGMYGADRTELGVIMDSYGCVEAYNLDGGGSSTVVIRRGGEFVVMNSPSDGRERTDANCILIVTKEPEIAATVAEKTGNSLTLNVNVSNNNGHDISDMVVKLNEEIKTVTNGQVSFSNLAYNTEYNYEYYYRDSDGNLIRLIQGSKEKTLKRVPIFIGFDIIETVDTFEIKILYEDIDLSGSFTTSEIIINDKSYFLFDGERSVSKEVVGTNIDSLSVNYSYDIGDGISVVVPVNDPVITMLIDLEFFFFDLIETQSEIIVEIYK